MSWSAAAYSSFELERTRPVRDLLGAVQVSAAAEAADLGCGPGNSTEILAGRFPGARIVGVDSSPDMIEAARRRLPNVMFELGDIAAWSPVQRFGVILSNAALQWVPDHASLFPRLVELVEGGGTLAVQMPDNLGELTQTLMLEVAAQEPWADLLRDSGRARTQIGNADFYYGLLKPRCGRVDIWRTTYMHPMVGSAAIVSWFRSTGLLPFLAPLGKHERELFLDRYTALVARAYPMHADGIMLLPMPRLFIVATRR